MSVQEPVKEEVFDPGGGRSAQPVLGDSQESGIGEGASGRAAANLVLLQKMWLVDFYRSGVGKKAIMAITGIVLVGFVFAHAIGNLKLYAGAESMNFYGEWLREILYPIVPHSGALWILRSVLIVALILHLHAAWALTMMNRRARPVGYESRRDYIAATFAARTMRWTGIIVLLFVIFHLMDLTFGPANPNFVPGTPYENTVASFQRVPVALFYIVANVALGLHLWHGLWSLFQSLGLNNRRFNAWRQYFAWGLTILIVGINVSFPIAVLTGVIA
jgi:succinate dehydrogenase / fumarate reductase cytochrome b subunit